MENRFIIVFSLFTFLVSFGQEKISGFSPKDKGRKDVFAIVNEADKKTALFFIDKTSLKVSQFNENMQLIDSLGINFSKKEVNDIIGHSLSKNQYFIYWTGSNSKEIVAQCFDFEAKKTLSHTIPFDKGKEKIINQFTQNNIFYIITTTRSSNVLNIYKFVDGKLEKNTADGTELKFFSDGKLTTFWDMYTESSGMVYRDGLRNISAETTPSLVLSTHKKKTYSIDNKLVFTFDINNNFTQMLTLDLSNFKLSQKLYTKPYTKKDDFQTYDSNSFLINNHLIQIKTSPTVLYLSVKDLEGNEIKSIKQEQDTPVAFKNSEIIQEDGSIKDQKILEKSNQFIRKTNNLNPSISGFFKDGKYHLVIGGVSYPKQDAVMLGGLIGGFTGALIASAFSSNYSVDNLNSYRNKRVVYIYSIFDKNFNHVSGDSEKTAFDKLRSFSEQNTELINQTIFKLDSKLFFGAYNKNTNEYSFYKFQE
ncbi:hypothetical protein ACI6PS_06770 [Flavobacterium sp. PLA-1-15]|uniref:hypothetical protein n=1 Tax=Flavobacterium sp. PLA-1-15 TaxID=3380533 RepID=UPI003B80BF79